jgi:signal recognition particle subunit SRP54
MLENLTQRLSRVVKTMRGEARLTETNTQDMLREVRLALLEADVSLPVVRDFVARVKEKALGEEVVGSLSPGQALVGVVHRELTALMGGDLGADASELSLAMQARTLARRGQPCAKRTQDGQKESRGGERRCLPTRCN